MLTGNCQCGAIRYAATGKIVELSHCHCSMCRRLHGAAFVSFAGVAREGFTWTSGEHELRTYASSAGTDRLFCGHCGSQLGCVLRSDPQHLYLAMSSVNGEPQVPPAFHQYVASGVSWYDADDGLPRYPAAYGDEA
jgi:hypothetical protein